MTDKYNPQEIEQHWQEQWAADGIYRQLIDTTRRKHYALTMLPYPSGDLHMGHWFAMCPSDGRARYMRMKGYNVLFPMGFDAFGLPAENAAIQRNIHPATWTYANIERMRKQLKSMGAMFDWEREIISCDPEYYRWTEWFFLQFYKAGLAYRTLAAVDFCPHCNTTLAREQVIGEDRHCERCGTPVIKKDLEQWFFRIIKYADELLDFSGIDWPERVITMQRNWIGRSEGAEIIFTTETDDPIQVFTTRPDTLFGATFLVLAPEHPLVPRLTTPDRQDEVMAYVEQARRQTEIARLSADKDKTGIFLGAYARHPLTEQPVPIWIADYVLMGYGTGAIMAVPAHDQRDYDFAVRYGLPIVEVIRPRDQAAPEGAAYSGPGVMVNSGEFNGLDNESGKLAIIDRLAERGQGKAAVTYRLRDWLISRQRYWGAPIPIVYCHRCGTVPIPEDQLPVLLPMDVDFRPTGESPLKFNDSFRYTTCPSCGGPAERETDTMDTFMCSSWYQYRYLSPHYSEAPWDPVEGGYWLPVDQYTGGIEHATMHLMYTRFFTKALRDLGLVNFGEPMLRLYNQGIILGEDNEKMSKSRGNVVAPDDLVQKYGADTVRAYLMFLGPWAEGGPWNSRNIQGAARWLNRVWTLALEWKEQGQKSDTPVTDDQAARALRRITHQTIKRVSDDLEAFGFNTVISALMDFTNQLYKARETPIYGTPAWEEAIKSLLLLMAPETPFIAEELWMRLGYPYSIHQQPWPAYDSEAATEELITVIVQVNGKVRDKVEVPADVSEADVTARALQTEGARRHLDGKPPRKVVYVPGRLVNIVV